MDTNIQEPGKVEFDTASLLRGEQNAADCTCGFTLTCLYQVCTAFIALGT